MERARLYSCSDLAQRMARLFGYGMICYGVTPRREVKLLPKNNMLSCDTSCPPLHGAALPTPQLKRDT